jgi:hypothetical protein
MIKRLFAFLAIAGLGWSNGAMAQTVCSNGAPPSAAGICPVFVQGDPSCVEAAQICSINSNQQPVVFSPVTSSTISGIRLRVVGTAVDVKDTFGAPDQQLGRPGFDAVIARRNSAYVYCGNDTIHDIYTAPGKQTPNQVTVCFAKGPCGLSPEGVTNACNFYNSTGVTANFLQAYKVGPIQQDINICGCSPFVARFCELRTPALDEDGNPRFVACNQDSSPLKSVEAEGTATIGTNTCILRSIGGRRVLIDSTTGLLC